MPRRKAVVLLQCAWSPQYAGGRWPRRSWLRTLQTSQGKTARAMRRLFPDDAHVWYDNATPQVAATSGGHFPFDPRHVRRVFSTAQPAFALACGLEAERACLAHWPGRLLVMPHPAWRCMSNYLLDRVADLLAADTFDRLKVTTTGPRRVVYTSLLTAEELLCTQP